MKLLIVSAGVSISALMAWRFSGLLAGLVGSVTAAGLYGGHIWTALEDSDSLLTAMTPLAMAVLVLAPILLYGTMPAVRWGPKLVRWIAAVWLAAALGSTQTLEAWTVAFGRNTYSPAVWSYLRQQVLSRDWPAPKHKTAVVGNRGPLVLTSHEIDTIRSGARWMPWFTEADVSWVLEHYRPDYILLSIPEAENGNSVTSVKKLVDSGLVDTAPAVVFPWCGNGNLQYQYRVYRLRGADGEK